MSECATETADAAIFEPGRDEMQYKMEYGCRVRTTSLGVARSLALAGIALCAAVSIATADDRSICGSAPPKSATIAACSRIIGAPTTSDHDRALALAFRAEAYRRDQKVAAAMADYDAAIGLSPTFELAFRNRGTLFFDTGDLAHAIADLDAAVRLAPQDAKALYVRGVAKRQSGDATGGSADIAAAVALDPDIASK
jgi:tetratricopeptide (TPR) repeat protein